MPIGKRKSSLNTDISTPEKRPRTDSTSNAPAPSPWEAKRLKIDLIAAKAQVINNLKYNCNVSPL